MSNAALSYLMFFIGYLLHMGLQIDAVVRAKNNAAVSRITVIEQNAFVLPSRLFASFLLLVVLRNHPEYLGPVLGFAGITVSSIAIATSSWLFAGGWGYIVDSIMTFIPVLKNFVPPLNDVKISVATTTQSGTMPKTVITTETTTQAPLKP
jgi:hypothetical protein